MNENYSFIDSTDLLRKFHNKTNSMKVDKNNFLVICTEENMCKLFRFLNRQFIYNSELKLNRVYGNVYGSFRILDFPNSASINDIRVSVCTDVISLEQAEALFAEPKKELALPREMMVSNDAVNYTKRMVVGHIENVGTFAESLTNKKLFRVWQFAHEIKEPEEEKTFLQKYLDWVASPEGIKAHEDLFKEWFKRNI